MWRSAIDRLRAIGHDERYDVWMLSEREQTVKRRNEENRQRKARERRDARKLARQREQDAQGLAERK